MTTGIDPLDLDAFVDGELELTRQLEFERRIAQDPVLREQVDELRRLRTTLRESAAYHPAPAALRRKLAAGASTRPARAGRGFDFGRLRWGWRSSLGAALVVIVSCVATYWTASRAMVETRLRDEVVAGHVRSTQGDRLVDIASSDRHTVKPWLASKLDYSPPVRDAKLGDLAFVGGRVDYVDGQAVAALVYRLRNHVVTAFVWPGPATDRDAVFFTQRGFQIANWARDGMTHWLVSDVNREEFAAYARLFESGD